MSKLLKTVLLVISHGAFLGIGFALGIYLLPILTAPPPPAAEAIQAAADAAVYTGEFRRDLADSDALHWGEGTVSISENRVVFEGELAPGPDYRLYLSPQFVETEEDFAALKSSMVQIGRVRTFENFMVELPDTVDPGDYNSAIVWCEAFGQFITAAQYQ